jgi:hypothetical protein
MAKYEKITATIWPIENDEHLLFVLIDMVQKGINPHFDTHYQAITNDLNSRIVNGQYTKLQVSQKVGRLKSNFKDFTIHLCY